MEELLERMLAVDQEGESLVKSAEAEALKIREESTRVLAEKSAAESRALAEECRILGQQILENARQKRSEALEKATRQLSPRGESFSRELEAYRPRLLKELLAL
ncbi:MAG: hypothetical protein ACI4SG_00330 [Oligosphaeraceae bacterium]